MIRSKSVLGIALILQTSLVSVALADDTGTTAVPPPAPSASASPAASNTIDCNHLPAQVDSQVTSQCAAAREAQNGADKNRDLSVVYAGVTALCAAACVSVSDWAGYCQYASLGATAVDVVTTKNFAGAMSTIPIVLNGGLGDKGAPLWTSTEVEGGTSAYENTYGEGGTTKTVDHGSKTACMTAAVSGFEMLMKNKAANDAEKSASQDVAAIPNLSGYHPDYSQGTLSGPSGSGGGPTLGGGGSTIASTSSDTTCSTASKTGNAVAVSQCAAATSDPASNIVKDPKFLEGIQKLTGKDPSEFFAKAASDGPDAAVAGALGNSFGADAGGALSKIFAAMDSELGADVGSGHYASDGRRGGGGGKADDPFAASMAALLAKLNGGDQAKKAGVASTQPKAERFPASVAEDRRVSLFDRVTYRYQLVATRLIDPSQLQGQLQSQAQGAPGLMAPASNATQLRIPAPKEALGQSAVRPY